MANFVGRIWALLLQIIFVPVQVSLLGPEAYGLVGFYVSLQGILSFLDLGLSSTTNREVARVTVEDDSILKARTVIRTFELPYWLIGFVIGLTLVSASGWIASNWLNTKELSENTVRYAIGIMGVSTALRWPVSLYSGVLQGIQRQIWLNLVNAVVGTARGAGAILVLLLVSRTTTAFFFWQLIVSTLEISSFVWLYRRALPLEHGARPHFDGRVFRRVWRFAFGVTLLTVLGALSTQLDRIAISKLLPLEYMGYYAIAGSAVGFLRIISGSIMRAVSPKMVVDLALDAKDSLSRTYHQTSQVMAFLAAGAGWALAFFAREILLLWIRSEVIAQETHVAMAFLSIGAMLGVIVDVQYNLCLATGSTKMPLVVSSIMAAALAPGMFLLIPRWGIAGAALPWMLFHVSFYVVWPYWLHQRILPGQAGPWVVRDTLPFIALGLVCFGISKSLTVFLGGPLAWYPILGLGTVTYLLVGSSWLPTQFRPRALFGWIRHRSNLIGWKVHV